MTTRVATVRRTQSQIGSVSPMTDPVDQIMAVFGLMLGMAGVLWLLGWIIYREIDVARWKSRDRRK